LHLLHIWYIIARLVYLQGIQVKFKFVYEDYQFKVKVTGAKIIPKYLFPQMLNFHWT